MSPFDPAGLKERLEELDRQVEDENFWSDQEKAQKDVKEKQEYLQELQDEIAGIGEESAADDETIRAAMEARDAAQTADEEARAYYADLQAFQADLQAAQDALVAAEKHLGELLQAQSEAEIDYENKFPMLEAYRVASIRLRNATNRIADFTSCTWAGKGAVSEGRYWAMATTYPRDESRMCRIRLCLRFS